MPTPKQAQNYTPETGKKSNQIKRFASVRLHIGTIPRKLPRKMENHKILLMIVIRAAICGLVSFIAFKFGPVYGMISVVCWGVLMAKPIVELGANWFNWARREPYEKWQGNYYEFADVQIRIFGRDGATQQKLWFAVPDILKVLGEKPSTKLELIYGPAEYWVFPEENVAAFSEKGVKKCLAASRHPQANAMRLWIEREVIKPHRKKLEIAKDISASPTSAATSTSTPLSAPPP